MIILGATDKRAPQGFAPFRLEFTFSSADFPKRGDTLPPGSSHFAASVRSNVNETFKRLRVHHPFVFVDSFIQSSLARNANVILGA
jgi:hypothetical protein